MAAGDTTITLIGNLVDDPELRFTPTGQAVTRFRIASTPRFMDRQTNEWKDGETLFLTCNVWRQAAENAAESLQRGMRVIVQGRLKQRSYNNAEGEKRTVYEVEVDEVGPSLRNATAQVTRIRSSRPVNTPPQEPWADDSAPVNDQQAPAAQVPAMAGSTANGSEPGFYSEPSF
ncbi:single-stranded DNA-binding protein [Nonomuraea sp. NPDC023979]|uniref:single-stranded DNA-binding protein n=1 Tax=Nonomuraea sp. NPDC023979 TaxID=3154796 RepID=UPI0033C882EF